MNTRPTHLDEQTLARLADEEPTSEEGQHIDACASCRRTLDAYRAQATKLELLSAFQTATPWAVVEPRLRREGLIAKKPRWRFYTRVYPRMRALAAAAAYLSIGLGAGLAIRSRETRESTEVTEAKPSPRLPVSGSSQAITDSARRVPKPTADSSSVVDIAARLAALQAIVLTTDEALRHSPTDAVIRNYHLSALAQRDALLGGSKSDRTKAAERWF